MEERTRFLTLQEVYDTPKPDDLIEGWLPANAVSILYGDTQAGKSFLGVAWTGCVLTGRSWMGRAVRHGPVVYAVSEDEDDYARRWQAWEATHESLAGRPFSFEPEGVQLLNERSVEAFIGRLRALPEPPVLIVVDTLGKSIVDGMRGDQGEVSANEMNRALLAAERIRRAAKGAAVLLIHHTTKDSRIIRGSAALKQGAYMVARLEGVADDGALVKLRCEKLKHRKPDPVTPTCREVSTPCGQTSLVFVEAEAAATSSRTPHKTGKREKRYAATGEDVYEVVRLYGPIGPTDIARALSERLGVPVTANAVKKHLGRLVAAGRVQNLDGQYAIADHGEQAA